MSCLFNSLSYFIVNVDPTSMRKMICDYLSTDPILFNNENSEEHRFSYLIGRDKFDTYINTMRSENTWGGAYEIKAFCNLFGAIVKVKVLQTNQWIEFIPSEAKNSLPILQISWNGNHYEPIK